MSTSDGMNTETRVTSTANPPALLTVSEAADELRCSIATVYREITEGHLAYHKVRGKRLIHRADLAAYIEKSRTCHASPSAVPTYTAAKRKLSAQARELIGDDDFEVKPRARKDAR